MPRILLSTIFATVLMFGFLGRAEGSTADPNGRVGAADLAGCDAAASSLNATRARIADACKNARGGTNIPSCISRANECAESGSEIMPLDLAGSFLGAGAGGTAARCSRYTASDFRTRRDSLKRDIDDKTRQTEETQDDQLKDREDFNEKLSDINKAIEQVQADAAERNTEAAKGKIERQQQNAQDLMSMKDNIRKLEQQMQQIATQLNAKLREKEILLIERSNALLGLECEEKIRKLGVTIKGVSTSRVLSRGNRQSNNLKMQYRTCLASLVKARQGRQEQMEGEIAALELAMRQAQQSMTELQAALEQFNASIQQREQIEQQAQDQAQARDQQTSMRLRQEMMSAFESLQQKQQVRAQRLATRNFELTRMNNELMTLDREDPGSATGLIEDAVLAASNYNGELTAYCGSRCGGNSNLCQGGTPKSDALVEGVDGD